MYMFSLPVADEFDQVRVKGPEVGLEYPLHAFEFPKAFRQRVLPAEASGKVGQRPAHKDGIVVVDESAGASDAFAPLPGLFGQVMPVGVEYGEDVVVKVLDGALVELIPIFRQEVIEDNVRHQRRITPEPFMEPAMALFYQRVPVGEAVDGPVQLYAALHRRGVCAGQATLDVITQNAPNDQAWLRR